MQSFRSDKCLCSQCISLIANISVRIHGLPVSFTRGWWVPVPENPSDTGMGFWKSDGYGYPFFLPVVCLRSSKLTSLCLYLVPVFKVPKTRLPLSILVPIIYSWYLQTSTIPSLSCQAVKLTVVTPFLKTASQSHITRFYCALIFDGQ